MDVYVYVYMQYDEFRVTESRRERLMRDQRGSSRFHRLRFICCCIHLSYQALHRKSPDIFVQIQVISPYSGQFCLKRLLIYLSFPINANDSCQKYFQFFLVTFACNTLSMCMYMFMYVYTYTYIHICMIDREIRIHI